MLVYKYACIIYTGIGNIYYEYVHEVYACAFIYASMHVSMYIIIIYISIVDFLLIPYPYFC